MADPVNKQNYTAPGWWETAGLHAGNGVMLGYLPQFMEMIGNEGDAAKVQQALDLGNEAHPTASWGGWGASMLGAGAGIRTAGAGIRAGMKVARPVVAGALGLASDAGKWALAKGIGGAAAKYVGSPLLAGSTAYGVGSMLSGNRSTKATKAADAPAQEQGQGSKTPAAPKADWYDQMSAISGLDRDTVKAMAKRDGGMRVDVLQTLSGMKPRAPTYRDLAMSYLMDTFELQSQKLEAAGDKKGQAALANRLEQTVAQILGSDPQGILPYDELK